MFGFPLYIHNTKKACFVRLRGCIYVPIQLDAPICSDAPCMFDAPHVWMAHCIFGCPPYASLYVLTLPYIWVPPYVWMPPVHTQHKESMLCQTRGLPVHMFGCPLYIHNTKKVCFVRLGVSICTHTFGCPLYV